MKIVIFAGGVGTRLWPLSRESLPKQFEKVVDNKSTIQLTADRLLPAFKASDIYISTNTQYVKIVQRQLQSIPPENIIGEPVMRDVGPAVGLISAILSKDFGNEPFAILWSDHLVRNEEKFRKILLLCEEVIKEQTDKIVFIAQKPRFASENLGWIEYQGLEFKKEEIKFYGFDSLKYRPDLKTAETFFRSGKHAWNLGYFVTTPNFLFGKYRQFVPAMYEKLLLIRKDWGSKKWDKTLSEIYPSFEKISFDNAILERLERNEAYVVSEELRWSDIGAWEALKEALQKSPNDNVTYGKVFIKDSQDSLIYNYNGKQLVATIDLKGMIVINTDDAILVCRKNSIPKIKKMVEGFKGTDKEYLT